MKTIKANMLIFLALSLAITTGILSVNYAAKQKDKKIHDELNRIESQMDKLQGELISYNI